MNYCRCSEVTRNNIKCTLVKDSMQGPQGSKSVSKCRHTAGELCYGTPYRPREDSLWSNPSIRLEATD
jgi:hypothetical protein